MNLEAVTCRRLELTMVQVQVAAAYSTSGHLQDDISGFQNSWFGDVNFN